MTPEEKQQYLKDRNWEHYPEGAYEDEAWLLPGRIQFEGVDSLDRAVQWQQEQEHKE